MFEKKLFLGDNISEISKVIDDLKKASKLINEEKPVWHYKHSSNHLKLTKRKQNVIQEVDYYFPWFESESQILQDIPKYLQPYNIRLIEIKERESHYFQIQLIYPDTPTPVKIKNFKRLNNKVNMYLEKMKSRVNNLYLERIENLDEIIKMQENNFHRLDSFQPIFLKKDRGKQPM